MGFRHVSYRNCRVQNSGARLVLEYRYCSFNISVKLSRLSFALLSLGNFEDYTLKFLNNASEPSLIHWPTVLTEFKAFTVCLWHKFYVQPQTQSQGILRYFADDGNFTLAIKNFDINGLKLMLIIWPRYALSSVVYNQICFRFFDEFKAILDFFLIQKINVDSHTAVTVIVSIASEVLYSSRLKSDTL